MIKAVLLDIDGTIRDSRAMIWYSYEQTFKHFNLTTPDKTDLAEHMHAGPELCFQHYAPEHDAKELVDYYRSILATVLDKIPAYDGVVQTLRALHGQGIKLGVVSASKFARNDLESNGVASFMDVVIDGHTTVHPKPNPEGANLALEKLHVIPEEALMIGDLPADIALGKAARLGATVAVTYGFGPRALLKAAQPDYIIDNFPALLGVIAKLNRTA